MYAYMHNRVLCYFYHCHHIFFMLFCTRHINTLSYSVLRNCERANVLCPKIFSATSFIYLPYMYYKCICSSIFIEFFSVVCRFSELKKKPIEFSSIFSNMNCFEQTNKYAQTHKNTVCVWMSLWLWKENKREKDVSIYIQRILVSVEFYWIYYKQNGIRTNRSPSRIHFSKSPKEKAKKNLFV